MTEDLLSNNFADSVNRSLIKKNFIATRIILSMIIVYSILELLNWFIAIRNSLGHAFKAPYLIYEYRIHPIVAFIIISISIISWAFVVKGNRNVVNAFEKGDAAIFNTGYRLYYKSSRLTLVSAGISVLSVCLRLLLKYLYDY